MLAGINFPADTIKVMLLTSAYVPNVDNNLIGDASANEISGATAQGYTAGGQTIANISVTESDANDEAVVDGDDVTWANSTITARYAAIYKDTGVPATSYLIDVKDFGAERSSSNGDFTIRWNATGIAAIR